MDGKNDVLVACTIGDLAWLKHGLRRGISANTRDREGLNGLHLAALNGKLECMKYILDNCGIAVDATATSTGNTALHYCISKKNGTKSFQCLKLLLERGANQNKRLEDLVETSARFLSKPKLVFRELFFAVKVDLLSSLEMFKAIVYTVQVGTVEETFDKSKAGLTPLHFSARAGLVKCVKALLEHGADIHITDKEGNTAYHIACVHSNHECARLLRSLHWASDKDRSLNQLRKEEALQRKRESETKALHSRLRREAADSAYASWLEKNDFNFRASTPTASMKRRQVQSHPEIASRCETGSHRVTQCQSAHGTHSKPKPVTPIKLSLEQTERNVSSVGKPDKMHPYTNYPPHSHRRHKSASRRVTTPQSKSSHSSRTVSTTITRATTPISIGAKYCGKVFKQKHPKTETAPLPDTPPEVGVHVSEPPIQSESPLHAKSGTTDLLTLHVPSDGQEDTIIGVSMPKEEEDSLKESFAKDSQVIFDLETDDDDLEDLAFHDVGHANSLNALALPNVLMKGKTPAEVLQLVRYLGNSDSRNLHRSRSYTHNINRHALYRNKFQRRLSLGAIPEGQMVTNYSSAEPSTSQLLDDHYFETLMHGYVGSQGKESRENAWGDEGECDEDDKADSNSEDGSGSESDDSLESDDTLESTHLAEINLPQELKGNTATLNLSASDSVLLKRRQPAEPRRLLTTPTSAILHSHKVSPPRGHSLKIVNLAWDPESNTVQTQVTESPMAEASFAKLGRKVTPPSRNISPRPRSTSPLDSSRFSSRSPSPQDFRTSSRSKSPHELKLSPTPSWSSIQTTQAPNLLAIPSSSGTHSTMSAHSLFSMSAIASKSVVSLGSVLAPSPAPEPQPPLARRVKSAPNLKSMDCQVLETAVFEFGGTLQFKHPQ